MAGARRHPSRLRRFSPGQSGSGRAPPAATGVQIPRASGGGRATQPCGGPGSLARPPERVSGRPASVRAAARPGWGQRGPAQEVPPASASCPPPAARRPRGRATAPAAAAAAATTAAAALGSRELGGLNPSRPAAPPWRGTRGGDPAVRREQRALTHPQTRASARRARRPDSRCSAAGRPWTSHKLWSNR